MSPKHVALLSAAVGAALAFVFLAQSMFQEVETEPAPGKGPPSAEKASFPDVQEQEFVEDRILVKLETGVPDRVLESLNARNGARNKERLPGTSVRVVTLPENLPVKAAVQRYEETPGVAYAEPDYLLTPAQMTPDDPGYAQMYALNNTGQTGGTPDADIDAPAAWQTTTGGPQTVVAVIDSGVDIDHPDLRDNIWRNVDEVPGNGRDDDGNGYVDDVNGWDFFHGDASVYDAADGDEHGTHVAGTIAAVGDNSTGVTGVSWRAQVMPLKFIGPNGGPTSAAIKAIDYALAEGVDISNNSWGGGYYSQALRDAISRADAAGHLFVAAAGNGGTDGVGDDNDASPNYPASFDNANIVSVAATDASDSLAGFSNFGARTVDLAAPGVGILSTLPGNAYGRYSGTSMATPHVAGTAVLLKTRYPDYDDARLKALLLKGVEPKPALETRTVTGGRLNAVAALTGTVAPDETEPTISPSTPKPGGRVKDRTPSIKATVKDDRAELAKDDMKLLLDGKPVAFEYDPATGTLTATAPRLSYAGHTAKVVATDAEGNAATRTWSFKVVR